MNKNGSGLVVGIAIIAIIAVVILVLAFMGFLPFSLVPDDDNDDMGDPIGSDYCGFSKGVMIDMFENLAGKDLNNDVGFTVLSAINSEACGSNSKLPSEIIGQYMTDFSVGWYVLGDETRTGAGYYYRTVIWGNAPLLSDSTLIKGVVSGNGVVINEWYDYSTITVTSHGTKTGYLAFIMWMSS